MKQNITIKQFNELSEKQHDILFEWIEKKGYSPYLTIGEMIEFLDQFTDESDFNIRIHSAGTAWKKPGQRLVDIDGLNTNEIEDEEELCDALWYAITQKI